jgi:ribosomal protein L11 methyltransferase
VSFWIQAPEAEWDLLVGALHELGTLGVEERTATPSGTGAGLVAYFDSGSSASRAILSLADPARAIAVSGPLPVPERDWSLAWREGLTARRVGSLWVRPSWCEPRGEPEVVIDPRQAFGTGEHASTRLALELVQGELATGDRLLDVGTGSGILALAALRLGAGAALGIECDPVACREARENAARNGLALQILCGTPAAIAPGARFDLVVANLLTSELWPWLDELARCAKRALVLSGYLTAESARLDEALAGARLVTQREVREEQGGDCWGARVVVHAAAR